MKWKNFEGKSTRKLSMMKNTGDELFKGFNENREIRVNNHLFLTSRIFLFLRERYIYNLEGIRI